MRTLLAALLVRTNTVVSTDRLIEEIWDDAPPTEPRSTLQAYVYRLRRLLPTTDDARVRTRSTGYLLETPPGSVDLDNFLAAVSAGRSAVVAGDHAEAVRRFGAGLQLWRGRAFDDVASRHVRSEARRLEDVRLATVEEKLSAELTLGRHAQVLPELDALVSEHPHRERLWAALMVALYRSGRQTEALAAFHSARRRMVDAAGVEPGADLRRLQEQILAGAAAETLPPATSGPIVVARPAPEPGRAPAELPSPVGSFVGRAAELDRLCGLLLPDGPAPTAGPRMVVVTGLGGTGRTTLAVHAAHRLADRFPDGTLHANLAGVPGGEPERPAAVLGRWLRALGVRPADVPADPAAATALFRSRTAGRRMLVVLDDAVDSAQVRPLIPAGGGSAVLVTGWLPLTTLDGVRVLRLGPMTEPDGVALLTELIGLARAAAEPQAVLRIVRLCGGLPLAIRVVAARLAIDPQLPVHRMADRMTDDHHLLDELIGGELSVRAAFGRSHRTLGADPIGRRAAHVLGLLGMLDRVEVDRRAAGRLAGPGRRTDAVLERLVATGLLDAPTPTSYRLHPLVRLFARERALSVSPP